MPLTLRRFGQPAVEEPEDVSLSGAARELPAETVGVPDNQFTTGLRSALFGWSAANLANDALKAEQARNREAYTAARREADVQAGRAQAAAPRVQSLGDIRDIGSAYDWLAGAAGQAVPSIAASIPAGLAGGAVAGPAGALLGAGAAFYPTTRGGIALRQYQDPRSAALPVEERARVATEGALVSSALEALVPAQVSRLRIRGVPRRPGAQFLATTGEEALTEAAQDINEQLQLQRTNPELAYDPRQTVESAALGAVGGGMMGAIPAAAAVPRASLRAAGDLYRGFRGAEPGAPAEVDTGGEPLTPAPTSREEQFARNIGEGAGRFYEQSVKPGVARGAKIAEDLAAGAGKFYEENVDPVVLEARLAARTAAVDFINEMESRAEVFAKSGKPGDLFGMNMPPAAKNVYRQGVDFMQGSVGKPMTEDDLQRGDRIVSALKSYSGKMTDAGRAMVDKLSTAWESFKLPDVRPTAQGVVTTVKEAASDFATSVREKGPARALASLLPTEENHPDYQLAKKLQPVEADFFRKAATVQEGLASYKEARAEAARLAGDTATNIETSGSTEEKGKVAEIVQRDPTFASDSSRRELANILYARARAARPAPVKVAEEAVAIMGSALKKGGQAVAQKAADYIDVLSEGQKPKESRQATAGSEEIRSTIFDLLRPEFQNDPEVLSQIGKISSLISQAEGADEQTKQEFLRGLYKVADAWFTNPDNLRALGKKFEATRSARKDVRNPQSVLYRSLPAELQDSIRTGELRQLATAVDDVVATNNPASLAVLEQVYGKDVLPFVLDTYQRRGSEPAAASAALAETEVAPEEATRSETGEGEGEAATVAREAGVTEREAPKTDFRFPHKLRYPTSSETTLSGAIGKLKEERGGKLSEDVKLVGYGSAMAERFPDTFNATTERSRLISVFRKRLSEAQKNNNRSLIAVYKGDLAALLDEEADDLGALDQLKVIVTGVEERVNLVTTDYDLSKMAQKMTGAGSIKVYLRGADGEPHATTLNLYSMWKHGARVATEPAAAPESVPENVPERVAANLLSSLAGVMARDDFVEIRGLSPELVVDPWLGLTWGDVLRVRGAFKPYSKIQKAMQVIRDLRSKNRKLSSRERALLESAEGTIEATLEKEWTKEFIVPVHEEEALIVDSKGNVVGTQREVVMSAEQRRTEADLVRSRSNEEDVIPDGHAAFAARRGGTIMNTLVSRYLNGDVGLNAFKRRAYHEKNAALFEVHRRVLRGDLSEKATEAARVLAASLRSQLLVEKKGEPIADESTVRELGKSKFSKDVGDIVSESLAATNPFGVGGIDEAVKDSIKRDLRKRLGENFSVLFKDLPPEISGLYNPATDTVEISQLALDPTTVAYHESLHALFQRLVRSKDAGARRMAVNLLRAASSPEILSKVEALLISAEVETLRLADPSKSDEELTRDARKSAALKQLYSNEEERLAYMYQMWASGLLDLNDVRTQNIFTRIRDFIDKIFNTMNQWEQAKAYLEAFHEGKFAEPSEIGTALKALNAKTMRDKLEDFAPAVSKLANRFATVSTDELREFGIPELTALADRFFKDPSREALGGNGFLQERSRMLNVYMNRANAILKNYSPQAALEALTALQSQTTAASQDGKGLQAEISALFDELHTYITDAGVKTLTESGWEPVKKVAGYFPRMWDMEKIRKDPEAFKALVLRELQATGKGSSGDALIAEALGTGFGSGMNDMSETEFSLGFSPAFASASSRLLTQIDASNAKDFAEWQVKDLALVLSTYINQAVHRAEYSRAFGYDGGAIKQAMSAAMEVLGAPDLARVSYLIRGMEGTLGWDMDPQLKWWSSAIITVENMALLGFSLITNLIDPISIAVRTGELKDAWEALKTGIGGIYKDITLSKKADDGEYLANSIGIIEQNEALESLGMTYNGLYMDKKLKQLNRLFFRFNGMEGWNKRMRTAALLAGMRFIRRHATQADTNPESERFLRELGLEVGDVILTDNGLIHAGSDKVRKALFRFVDGAVLRPNPATRAGWMNDPHFALVAHLKQFTFAFQTMIIRRANNEASWGNHAPMMAMMTALPFGIVTGSLRSMIAGKSLEGLSLLDFLQMGINKSGVAGVGQFYSDSLEDIRRGRPPGYSLLGPAFDHFAKLVESVFGNRSFVDAIYRTIPGGNVAKAAISD